MRGLDVAGFVLKMINFMNELVFVYLSLGQEICAKKKECDYVLYATTDTRALTNESAHNRTRVEMHSKPAGTELAVARRALDLRGACCAR